ncbi:MAG: hypothetical protein U0R80_01965 [Nocardioidaceae bacterium]
MNDLIDLRELFESELGEGPAHRPLDERLRAGRSAVRRRRLAEVGAGVTAVVIAGVLLVGGPGRPNAGTDAPEVDEPSTPAATQEAWAEDELARFAGGTWETRPGVEVVDRVDNPLHRRGRESSEGLAVVWKGEETWLLLDHTLDRGRGEDSVTSFPARVAMPDLASWVDQQVALQHGDATDLLVRFGDGETLEPVEGATILAQRPHPALPDNFAGPGDRTAVAKVRLGDQVWFVLAREIGGQPDFIPTAASIAGPGIDDFLAYAEQQYAGGEGLR